MPLVGWICPNSRKEVEFDHFENQCDCRGDGTLARRGYSPFLARLAADKVLGDVRHQGLGLTATGVMDCPRLMYLERTVKYHANPTPMCAMHRGTALHGVMADRLDAAVWSTEANDPVRHDLRGTIGPYEVSALADAWRHDLTEIVDAKFPKDWSVKYRAKDGRAKLEHAVQLNIERHLMAQQSWAIEAGFDPDNVRLVVWDHGVGATEGPAELVCDHMTVEEILAVRPWGSQLTIADHADLLVQIKEKHEEIEPGLTDARMELAATIPLVGQTMFGGGKCAACVVKGACDALVVKYGVPA